MEAYDLFNGDADGICALHQLRMAFPREARLVTGIKRDIALVRYLPEGQALDVTVLDVSFDKNDAAVRQVLEAGGRVQYFDHHAAHTVFEHPHLETHIDPAANVCTSLLVDRHLGGRFRDWAIVGAFGDNLGPVARALAEARGHAEHQTAALERLGTLLNYNGYGEAVADLHIHPEQLYRAVHGFANPFDFVAQADEFRLLSEGYDDDQRHMAALRPYWQSDHGEVYVLPGETWARRLSGTLANQLVAGGGSGGVDQGAGGAGGAEKSFAILTGCTDGGYVVSVRTSARCTGGAEALCSRYPTGGGRRAAAGINQLPASELDRFIADFAQHVAGEA